MAPCTAIAQNTSSAYFTGRVDHNADGTTNLYWPGTTVSTRFTGTSLKVFLKDATGHNSYHVVIDGRSAGEIKTEAGYKSYEVATGLAPGKHTATLHRQMDWYNGATVFHGFSYDSGARTFKIKQPRRRIIFYGNSITVGAGMRERDTAYKGPSTNNYLSYSARTARHFGAEYHCVSSSGIGLMISWGDVIMPEIYNRLNPADSSSQWNFSKDAPELVVINLLENDASLSHQPKHPQFIRRFGDKAPTPEEIIATYARFIQQLRQHYPKALFICALGSMGSVTPGSPWPDYIRKAVASLNDPAIHTHFFPYVGGNGHPNAAEHQAMAQSLIKRIDEVMKWRN